MIKKILYVTSEVQPYASTGGLGDVLEALPKSLKADNSKLDVRVVCPLYKQVKEKYGDQLKTKAIFETEVGWRNQYCGVVSLKENNIEYLFIDNEYYFKRPNLYGYYDDGERFAYFSKAVLDMLGKIKFVPDVIHFNDWQTAYGCVLLKFDYLKKYKNVKTIFTIHNIQYQGIFGLDCLGDIFDINNAGYPTMSYNGSVNLMKAAIECADIVTTVSKRYSEEIKTEEYSYGLSPILNKYSKKVTGIINGIDYDVYNPETDKYIPHHFSYQNIRNKKYCKKALATRFGIEDVEAPLIAMVTRLVEPKGVDFVIDQMDNIMKAGANFILLGTGDRYYEEQFLRFNEKYPGRCKCIISYDRDLSHLIYAGTDIFLMPSRSEACGLAQMISSRYGTVPVVHEVGGLYDTIKSKTKFDDGNGFTFEDCNSKALFNAVNECITYYNQRNKWKAFVKEIMQIDFSWSKSAKEYLSIYNEIQNRG